MTLSEIQILKWLEAWRISGTLTDDILNNLKLWWTRSAEGDE